MLVDKMTKQGKVEEEENVVSCLGLLNTLCKWTVDFVETGFPSC